jgi:hypothetical protein
MKRSTSVTYGRRFMTRKLEAVMKRSALVRGHALIRFVCWSVVVLSAVTASQTTAARNPSSRIEERIVSGTVRDASGATLYRLDVGRTARAGIRVSWTR